MYFFFFQNMNNLGLNTNALWKCEILAEVSFHSKTPKNNKTVKLLCSRLLARHRLKSVY